MAYSGRRIVTVAGPVDHGGATRTAAALVEFAHKAGPRGRLGLIPDSDSLRWRFHPDSLAQYVFEIDPVSSDELSDTITSLVRRDISAPVWVALAGGFVFCGIDHGVGDGAIALTLTAIVAGAPVDQLVRSVLAGSPPRLPSAAAFLGALRANPEGVARGLTHRFRHKGFDNPALDLAGVVNSVGTHRGALAIGSPDTGRALEAFVQEQYPQASSAGVRVATVASALNHVGLRAQLPVYALFDARRSLPTDRWPSGNFAVGLDLLTADIDSPQAVTDAMRKNQRAGLPALGTAMHTSKSAARVGLRRARRLPVARSLSTQPWLTVSDMGSGPPGMYESLQWTQGAEFRCFGAYSEPFGPDALTVTCGNLGGRVTFTASFNDAVFDAGTVARALDLAANAPLELLEGSLR